MRGIRLLAAALVTSSIAWAWPGASIGASGRSASYVAGKPVRPLPLAYEPNVGQFPGDVLFAGRGSGFTLLLRRSGMTLVPAAAAERRPSDMLPPRLQEVLGDTGSSPRSVGALLSPLQFRFAGANLHAAMQPSRRLRERVNYFLGRDPARWHTDVPTYARIKYRNLYPGIDLLLRGTSSVPEFDWIVRPGGDPQRIGLALGGAGIRVTSAGIMLRLVGRTLAVPAPTVYQRTGGRTLRIPAGYRVDRGVVRIALGRYDRSRPLVIDPKLIFSKLLGGANLDNVNGLATDALGATYIVGDTQSADFPIVGGLPNTDFKKSCSPSVLQCRDVFVMKLDPKGAVVFSTYLGGTGFDSGYGVAADSPGNVFVSGNTGSADFPMANPLQSSFQATCPDVSGAAVPCRHVFVTKLDSAGDKLLYSTYFGGSNQDLDGLVTANPAGEAYLTGLTQSADLPQAAGTPPQGNCAAGPLSSSAHICLQVFLAKLSPAGRLDYDLYFGGSADDVPTSVALNPAAEPVITGVTGSSDLPVMNAPQASPGGGSCSTNGQTRACLDGFVAQFSNTDGSLSFSTYLGGSGDDEANQVAFDPSGAMDVAGTTYSTNFPTTAALQSTKPDTTAGDASCFVTKLSPSGQIVYSTYLGGSQATECNADAVDANGDVFAGGTAAGASGLPLTNATQSAYGGGDTDGYVAELNPGGSAVLFGTLLGGSGHDEIDALAVDGTGHAVAGGWTASTNFPVTTGQTIAGGGDGFIANIDPTVAKPVTCPKNSTMKKGKCACKKGYTMKKGKCIKKKK
jgi:hypothetical protein